MRNPKDILVTTTEKIDGIEIIQYIKPISAHVVTGTGFLVTLQLLLVMYSVVVLNLIKNS